MFLESLLETSTPAKHRRGWATVASFLIEAAAIGLLIVLPMLYTNALPSLAYAGGVPLAAPPRGDPGPPPTGAATVHHATPPPRSDVYDRGGLVAPHQVPRDTWKPKPGEDYQPGPPSACEGCVPGGTGNGPVNPVIANVVRKPVVSPQPPIAPVPVVSRISEGMLIRRVQPTYPQAAVITHVQGAVIMRAIIDRNGVIRELQVQSGHPLLVKAAVDAVREWRYRPFYLNGQAVEVGTQITVNFVLKQ